MSDIGSRFRRVLARGEAWLPLLAFAGAAALFVIAGTAPEGAEAAPPPASGAPADATRSGGDAVAVR